MSEESKIDREEAINPTTTARPGASVNPTPHVPGFSSGIGVYDRPARRMANRMLSIILLLVAIFLLALWLYQWWF
ncbi:MAG: hypothetical protein NT075_37355 [Chloroflexi bacterium]|nr:hypothetical protein [Chloroflexota bacterium]